MQPGPKNLITDVPGPAIEADVNSLGNELDPALIDPYAPQEEELPLPGEEEDIDEVDEQDSNVATDHGERPSLVVVDHELSPNQARNLERATGAQQCPAHHPRP